MMLPLLNTVAQSLITENELEIPKNTFGPHTITNVLRIVFGLAGAIAFLLVTFAGLKYVLSQGNPQETAKAKNAIIDALIGLVIAMSAFAIVSFLITRLA